MPIRPQDVDQHIQEALQERLLAMFQPGASLDPTPAPAPASDVVELQNSVGQINRETRAVEEAVAEVLTLRA